MRHLISRLVLVTGFFLLCSSSFADSADPIWQARSSIPDTREGNLYFDLVWSQQEGAQIRIASANGVDAVTAVISPLHPHVLRVSTANGPAELLGETRFDVDAMPKLDVSRLDAVLKIRPYAWTLYVHNLPVMQWPAPFSGAMTVLQPVTQIPQGSPDDAVYFQRSGTINFAADFMVQEGQKNPLGTWEPIAGDWSIHSVMDSVMELAPTDRIKQRPMEAERSPNFYSVQATGTDAIILNGYDFYDSYQLSAALETQPGAGGLVFLYQDERNHYRLILSTDDKLDTTTTVQLWRYSTTRMPRRVLLREVEVPITAHQWVRPGVKVWNESITVSIDDSDLFTVKDELASGGRFGLYANGEAPRRFDDVQVNSVQELDLSDTHRLRFYTLATRGDFFQRSALMGLMTTPVPRRSELRVPPAPTDQWLVVGREADPGHVFSAVMTPGALGEMGLMLGYTGANAPYLRFVRSVDRYNEVFTLQQVAPGSTTDLDEFRLPIGKDDPLRPVTLMADGTAPNELRLYRDGEMVFIHTTGGEFLGASGIFVGAQTPVTVSQLKHDGRRSGLHVNQAEKNRNYVVDPFMRHWSSPEGQWHQDEAGRIWHKSDFFGRFNMSLLYVEGSQIHLGVPEDSDTGAVVLAFTGNKVKLYDAGGLSADEPLAEGELPTSVADVVANPPATLAERLPDYTVNYEGYRVWVTSHGQTVLNHRLPRPLSGSRVRLSGFTLEQLSVSLVQRYQVMDYLFNRAPSDWSRNGGTWEIVNRFQCDPRWSHMNGEAPDNLGALWAKYDFKGDFCVEMYAGIRHGDWYNRCGDLNITMLNRTNSPSSGYTITTTGWDRDKSQLWTRIFRDGKQLDRSDMYLVPRNREGNIRKYLDPLINDGRPVHGAWYYLKFRRIGNKLEYWFDNQLVFQIEEKENEKLDLGGMGIWTYMNSMMVARVTVAAEEIRPRRIAAIPAVIRLEEAARSFDPEPYARILQDGVPAQRLLPQYWQAAEDPSFTHLAWQLSEDFRPYLVATNTLGSGRMWAQSDLPPAKLSAVAGYAFEFKRKPGAQVNFHYQIGVMEGTTFKPQRHFYHRLSGPSGVDPAYTQEGATDIPETRADINWHQAGAWTTVHAWMPTHLDNSADTLYVKVTGFGVLQASDTMQGLTGNQPGAAYAVCGFGPIGTRPPSLARNEEHSTWLPRTYIVNWPDNRRDPVRSKSPDPIFRTIANDSRDGFNHRRLRIMFKGGITATDLYWVNSGAPQPTITVRWDADHAGAFLVQLPEDNYDRRLFAAHVAARSVPLRTQVVDQRTLRAFLPRDPAWQATTSEPLTIAVGDQSFTLDWSQRKPEPPVLTQVDGYSPFFMNFESLAFAADLIHADGRMRIQRYDGTQGAYMAVVNDSWGQRLLSSYAIPFSLAKYPLLHFRYRGDEMDRVTLSLGNSQIAFSEDLVSSPVVRLAPPRPTLDGTWQSWIGMVSDSNAGTHLATNRFNPGSMKIASVHGKDQTGALSELDLDDLMFGPAVRQNGDLAFTPSYFDYGGVRALYYTVHAGPKAFEDLQPHERGSLKWIQAPPGQPIQPQLDPLNPGVFQVYVKAVDTDSRESRVSSLPFLYDNRPPVITHSFDEATKARKLPVWTNGTLLRLVANTDDGAPLDLQALTFSWNGKAIPPHASYSSLTHAAGSTVISYNWPFELRNFLDRMQNGETGTLTVSGLVDGAGNATSDLTIPITINTAADTSGPTLLRPQFGDNVAIHANWYGMINTSPLLEPAPRNTADVNLDGPEPFLSTLPSGNNGVISVSQKGWTLAKQPYLAMRLRRPNVPETDPMLLRVIIRYEDKKHRVLHVTVPDGSQPKLDPPFVWKKNEWQNLNLNLAEGLSLNDKDNRLGQVIQKVDIQRVNAADGDRLDLMAVCAYGDWSANDAITLPAYDRSGVVGLQWDYLGADETVLKTGQVEGKELKPAALGLPATPNAWLLVYAVDRAGHRSAPLRVPYHP